MIEFSDQLSQYNVSYQDFSDLYKSLILVANVRYNYLDLIGH